jgi:O-antigen/teichoic acid export membrane protein
MTFLQKSSLTLFMRVGGFALGFIVQVWIARALGPAGKGEYAIFTLVPGLIAQLAGSGIYNANIYLIGKGRALFKTAAENTFTVSLLASAVLMLGYALARSWLDAVVFKTLPPEITKWFFYALPFNILFLAFNYLALARDDFFSFNLPNVTRPALILLGMLLLTCTGAMSLQNAIIAWVAASLILALHAWWLLYKRERFGLGWHRALFRESLQFGWQSHLGTVFYYLGWRLDFILCNLYLEAKDVGNYSIAALAGEVLWFIPNTFSVVLLPHISRMEKEQSENLTEQVCRLTLLTSAIGAVLAAASAPLLVPFVFGKDFSPAVIPLLLLLPGLIMESGTRILTSFLVGRGFPMTTSFSAMIVAISNLLLNLWCIPHYGIAGAALAGTISYSLGALYLMRSFHHLTGISYARVWLLQSNDLHLLRQLWLRIKSTRNDDQSPT